MSWPKGPRGKRRFWRKRRIRRKWRIWRKFVKGLTKEIIWVEGPCRKRRIWRKWRIWRKFAKGFAKANELAQRAPWKAAILGKRQIWQLERRHVFDVPGSLKFTFCINLIQKRLLWALAIGHWEAIVWRTLKRSISMFLYVLMPKAQLPKQLLLNLVYIPNIVLLISTILKE